MQAVDGVSFELRPGEVLAIVGESGSGKSVTAQTAMGLTRSPNARIEGSVRLRGRELLGASEAELQKVRGEEVAMIFQDPMTSLNPVYRVGDQIVEAIRAHRPDERRRRARAGDRDAAARSSIPEPEQRVDSYPHEFSGGHAAAGDDRDGAGAGAERADRRRANHSARRDDPGADPLPAGQTQP